jgi:hypothetical protein
MKKLPGNLARRAFHSLNLDLAHHDDDLGVQFANPARDCPDYNVLLEWLESRGFRVSSLFPICQRALELVEFECVMVKHRE